MKIPLTRIALLVSPLFLAPPASASVVQEPAPASAAETLPPAREVIERFVEVTNSRTRIEKTSSQHLRGTATVAGMGLTGPLEVWQAKPNRRVTRVELGGFGEVSSGFDGEHGWSVQAMLGARLSEGPELLLQVLESAYDAELKPSAYYESLEVVAKESFEGKDCYKVKVVAKPLEGMDPEQTLAFRTSHEFYAVDSGLLQGVVQTASSPMGEMTVTAVITEYKKFGEYLLPSKSVMKQPGANLELVSESVEFDTVTDDAFTLPKEIQALVDEKKTGDAAPAPPDR